MEPALPSPRGAMNLKVGLRVAEISVFLRVIILFKLRITEY